MGFIYRLFVFISIIIMWAFWMSPSLEDAQELSFIIFAILCFYLAGDGEEGG